jgi:hypothetical protein
MAGLTGKEFGQPIGRCALAATFERDAGQPGLFGRSRQNPIRFGFPPAAKLPLRWQLHQRGRRQHDGTVCDEPGVEDSGKRYRRLQARS